MIAFVLVLMGLIVALLPTLFKIPHLVSGEGWRSLPGEKFFHGVVFTYIQGAGITLALLYVAFQAVKVKWVGWVLAAVPDFFAAANTTLWVNYMLKHWHLLDKESYLEKLQLGNVPIGGIKGFFIGNEFLTFVILVFMLAFIYQSLNKQPKEKKKT